MVLQSQKLREEGKIAYHSIEVFNHVRAYIIENYIHVKGAEITSSKTYGGYFPELYANPGKYIQYNEPLRKALLELREKGVKTWVGTNSHCEYTNLILTASLGEDWKSLFDFKATLCEKPRFFQPLSANPFHLFDFATITQKEVPDSQLNGEDYFVYGNYASLNKFFEE